MKKLIVKTIHSGHSQVFAKLLSAHSIQFQVNKRFLTHDFSFEVDDDELDLIEQEFDSQLTDWQTW